jgi:exodeoxyribonuclease V gamma subunit
VSGLHIYRSNRIEVLAEVLASMLSDPALRPADPVVPVRIGVGSRGMERWLRHRLATKLNVCAHVDFPFPSAVIGDVLTQLLGPVSDEAGWDEEWLTWTILEVLPGLLAQGGPVIAPLANYLSDVTDGVIHSRELALAQRIAQVFDRYALYRPALVRHWSGHPVADPPVLPKHLAWQAALWRHLVSAHNTGQTAADRLAAAHERLQSTSLRLHGDQPIRLFGVSTLPPAWLELLSEVANHIPVELYVPCASVLAWDGLRERPERACALRQMDRTTEVPSAVAEVLADHVDHPLLDSLGRSALDMAVVLDSQPTRAKFDIGIDPTNTGTEGASTLCQLQVDLLRGCARTDPVDIAVDDRSLGFHACPGPARQVEVLRDVILDLLDRDPTLGPRDIAVMTPDIDAYAPLLTAAFGAGSPIVDIPIAISDRHIRQVNPVVDALVAVLDLAADRVTASATLDVLSLGPVARRFGLTPEDLARVRSFVAAAGFRWGLDAADRADSGQPATAQNTLAFAADRLALGVVMADEGQAVRLDAGEPLTPLDTAQGAALPAIGRFLEFAAVLRDEVRILRVSRGLGAWVDQLLGTEKRAGTLGRLTATSGAFAWSARQAREMLSDLRVRAAHVTRPIDIDAIRQLIHSRSRVPSASSHAATGAVTCCALMPMRAVPYRVICLLGMDEDAFPRAGTRPGFDWTRQAPRIGDPNRTDEDRLMFLESILSARDHLAVLYTGRNERTNEPCAPCVPVSELFDVLDQQFNGPGGGRASAHFTKVHPLQAFDARCFRPGDLLPDRPWSFDAELCAAAKRARDPRHSPVFIDDPGQLSPVSMPQELSLDALSRFLAHPCRTLVERRFGVGREWLPAPVVDHLPSAMESAEVRDIGRYLLNRATHAGVADDHTVDLWLTHLQGRGVIPAGDTAGGVLHGPRQVIDRMRAACSDVFSVPETTADIRIPMTVGGADVTVVGRVSGIRDRTLMRFFWGGGHTTGARWWVPKSWVDLVAWSASAGARAGQMCTVHGGLRGGSPTIQCRTYAAPSDARKTLEWMVGVWLAGMRAPFPLFSLASSAFAWHLRSSRRRSPGEPSTEVIAEHFEGADLPAALHGLVDAAHRRARSAWGTVNGAGDASDPHIARLYGDQVPLTGPDGAVDNRFAASSLRFWGPIFAGRTTSTRPPQVGARP